MQTNRSFTSQGRRAQIVDAAVRVIAREGIAKASFTRIATEAGLSSPGMISYHFADKDELLSVLCDTTLDGCVAELRRAVEGAAGPADAFEAYIAAFIRWQDLHRDALSALWQLAAGWRRPNAPHAFDEAPLHAPLEGLLRDGAAAGAFRTLDPTWTAQSIVCAVKGYQQAMHDDPQVDAASFTRTLVDLFGQGLIL